MNNKENTVDCAPGQTADTGSRRILEAVAYLNQCRVRGHSFAIVSGGSPGKIDIVLRRFSAELPPGSRMARILAPTDSSHGFLEAVLAQLGFDPFESTADDLQRLLTVVLREGATQRVSTILLIEDAQEFGPRVFETIRELARNSRDMSPPPLILMTGPAALNRVLDSQGMASIAQLTRLRFDLDAPATPELPAAGIGDDGDGTPAQEAPKGPALVLSMDDDIIRRYAIDRERLLIGRSHYSDVCIASRYVSRQHALLLRNPDGDWLIDLKSTNGTSVNSKLVQQRRLEHDDVVSIGNYRLRYENPAGRTDVAPINPSRDQLSETMVMRSLQALRAARDESPAEPDSSTSTAA